MLFEFNYSYYSCIFYEENLDFCSKSKIANTLIGILKKIDNFILRKFLPYPKISKISP